MEFQIHKHNQTLMERIFRQGEIAEGVVQRDRISSLLHNLHPELTFDTKELQRMVAKYDPDGSGILDFDAITNIIFHFLLKQSAESLYPQCSEDSESVGNEKTPITLNDFVAFNTL